MPPVDPQANEYLESTSTTFEWTVKGLKNLFDSTKGESKSKVTKSMKFAGGRWQILFYPNAGPSKDKEGAEAASGTYISLYLCCEPTVEEKEKALNDGKWVREGNYKFSFELTNLNKTSVYNVKEAQNHTFTQETANWGWAQFAKRDAVYYNNNPNRNRDAFVIICTITRTPSPPAPPPPMRRKPVPMDLLYTVGALLDDPTYSDVEFILPRRGQPIQFAKKIWASKRILSRAEYFDAMFNSGFAETNDDSSGIVAFEEGPGQSEEPDTTGKMYNDSDDEDDDTEEPATPTTRAIPEDSDGLVIVRKESDDVAAGNDEDGEDARLVHADEASSLTKDDSNSEPSTSTEAAEVSLGTPNRLLSVEQSGDVGPKKRRVIVKDVAYTTYHAVLYWLYTDWIVFAPLSSSFSLPHDDTASPVTPTGNAHQTVVQGNTPSAGNPRSVLATSRRQWIAQWMESNPGKLRPCSAKAVYRIADRLNLVELKERASQHIYKSLTADNIAYEVFSPFAAAFDDIRKFEVDFFLKNWATIRDSKAMRDVWQQIRVGHHPGFEEVWPVILFITADHRLKFSFVRQHGHNLPHVAHNCLVIILAIYAVVRVSGRVLSNPDVLAPVDVALFLARSEVGLVFSQHHDRVDWRMSLYCVQCGPLSNET
ncbi:MATH domain-containing protein [Pleurotus pulmonarius]